MENHPEVIPDATEPANSTGGHALGALVGKRTTCCPATPQSYSGGAPISGPGGRDSGRGQGGDGLGIAGHGEGIGIIEELLEGGLHGDGLSSPLMETGTASSDRPQLTRVAGEPSPGVPAPADEAGPARGFQQGAGGAEGVLRPHTWRVPG